MAGWELAVHRNGHNDHGTIEPMRPQRRLLAFRNPHDHREFDCEDRPNHQLATDAAASHASDSASFSMINTGMSANVAASTTASSG